MTYPDVSIYRRTNDAGPELEPDRITIFEYGTPDEPWWQRHSVRFLDPEEWLDKNVTPPSHVWR